MRGAHGLWSCNIKLQGTVVRARGRKICTSICLQAAPGYRNEAARHSMICLRRLSSNRAAYRRGSNSIESTPFCRARRCAGSQRRTRPNLFPKHRHEAFPRTSGPPRRVDTRNLLARLPWPEATLVGPVAFACAPARPPFEESGLALSNLRAASDSSSSTMAAGGDECFSTVNLSHRHALIGRV